MAMVKKKICMLGAFSVGKTSLVQQFVLSQFSTKYLTTIGVKIDKKALEIDGLPIDLIIWDIHGEDSTQDIAESYLRGASGYVLVADGTRKETVEVAQRLGERMKLSIGDAPSVLMLNKADLTETWELDDDRLRELRSGNRPVIQTSAKTGTGVDEAFHMLADKLV